MLRWRIAQAIYQGWLCVGSWCLRHAGVWQRRTWDLEHENDLLSHRKDNRHGEI
jgi:hypothetical protein